MQQNLRCHVAGRVLVAKDLDGLLKAALGKMVVPDGFNDRLGAEEAADACDCGLIKDVQEILFHVGVRAALEGWLFNNGRPEKENETIDISVCDRSKVAFFHVGSHLGLPLVQVPVVPAAADGRLFEVLNTVGPEVAEDLFVRSVEPESCASRSRRSQGNLIEGFIRLQMHTVVFNSRRIIPRVQADRVNLGLQVLVPVELRRVIIPQQIVNTQEVVTGVGTHNSLTGHVRLLTLGEVLASEDRGHGLRIT